MPRPTVHRNAYAVVVAGDDHDRQVLLVRRRYEPQGGMLSLPRKWIQPGQNDAQIAVEALAKETGLSLSTAAFTPIALAWDHASEAVPFLAALARPARVTAGPDATEAVWHPLHRVLAQKADRRGLAFHDDELLNRVIAAAGVRA